MKRERERERERESERERARERERERERERLIDCNTELFALCIICIMNPRRQTARYWDPVPAAGTRATPGGRRDLESAVRTEVQWLPYVYYTHAHDTHNTHTHRTQYTQYTHTIHTIHTHNAHNASWICAQHRRFFFSVCCWGVN
jgi:hypothetical protein